MSRATRAAAAATSAGTPPYLDPFLGTDRDRFDSAAERYSAAVVLYEMAVGRTPVYGDGQADPAAITDDVSIDREAFDSWYNVWRQRLLQEECSDEQRQQAMKQGVKLAEVARRIVAMADLLG